ncbi:MAG: hypothetical protein HOO96_42285 [Polyangiaceae bacterium]|nr:hypothetical protein [Polyangiaceae bacterium]
MRAPYRTPEAARPVSRLANLRVATPCAARWDDMLGDGNARHCLSCDRPVYDVSAMGAAEAEAFLDETAGTATCIRFHRRADGTLITADCPVGIRKRRLVVLEAAAIVCGVGLAAAAVHDAIRVPAMSEFPTDVLQADTTVQVHTTMGLRADAVPEPSVAPKPRLHLPRKGPLGRRFPR